MHIRSPASARPRWAVRGDQPHPQPKSRNDIYIYVYVCMYIYIHILPLPAPLTSPRKPCVCAPSIGCERRPAKPST